MNKNNNYFLIITNTNYIAQLSLSYFEKTCLVLIYSGKTLIAAFKSLAKYFSSSVLSPKVSTRG